MTPTDGVVVISRHLGRPNFHALRKATVTVRVNGDGAVTIYAQDHETNDTQTIDFTTTIPPVEPPVPTVPPPATVTPPDLKPRFSTTISDKSWTRNSRISSFTLPQRLSLADNELTGSIPTQLGNLSKATHLHLGGNKLTGCVPAVLRSVSTNDLSRLSLSNC